MDSDLAKLKRSPADVARWQKAQQHVVSGRPGLALAVYRDLVKRYPGVDQLWFEQGVAAGGDLDFVLANQCLQRAAKLAPRDVSLLVLIAQQYHRLHRPDQARDCFRRAVAADPGSIHAQLSLAAWLERERKLEDAQRCVETCLAQRPRDAQAKYFHAFLLHRQGKNTEAEAILRGLIGGEVADPNINYSARHLLGVVLDALGEYAEAMRWLGEARTLLRQMTNVAALEQQYDEADRRRRELLAGLTPEILRRWRAEGPAAPRGFQLAFLGGHPRSGTTLLEQILGAHPDVMAFDEPEAFAQEVLNALAPMPPAKALTLEELNALTPARRLELNNRYLKSLLRDVEGEPAARVLLDKNPSPTSSLHLWLRVFPDLKVIIPLRDPRDVILSCYFQNLALTPTNANFLSHRARGETLHRSDGCLAAAARLGRV